MSQISNIMDPIFNNKYKKEKSIQISEIYPLSLRINFIWTLFGNLTYALCQWGMTVIFAKIGSPEMVGQFALGLAITAPIILFAGLALRPVQATDARRIYQFGDYLGLRLVTTFFAVIVIAGIVWKGNYNGEARWTILFIGLAKGFEAISDIFYGLFQQHERMDRIAKSMMIKGPLSLAALTLAVMTTHRVGAGAFALAIAWLVVLVLYDIQNGARILSGDRRIELIPKWHPPTLLRLTRLAFPLGLTLMLISLNSNIPRYFIEHYWGPRELGFFAAVAYLMIAGTTVVNALGQSASPRLAKYYALGNKQQFSFLLLRLIGMGLALGVAGILISLIAGRIILALIYRPEYAHFNHVLVWVMAAAALSYVASFLGYAMTAAHYFAIQPGILGAAALANALSCVILVPSYGPLGAAWALGVANGLQVLLSSICVFNALHRMHKGGAGPEVVLMS
jgi:O-antigen/teichoic acid export membrane protein